MRDGWLRRRLIWYFKRDVVNKWRAKRDGKCARCGKCCGSCIAHDLKNQRCRIYKLRPDICKAFPLTPEDILKLDNCGYEFKK
ncbi:MAG: hypothetical protein EHM14_05000 [Methanothrix sp.]|nr:MAG: hypothetical protein EHM14_05000 [Methanothrix sp.]